MKTNKKALLVLALACGVALQPTPMVAGLHWKSVGVGALIALTGVTIYLNRQSEPQLSPSQQAMIKIRKCLDECKKTDNVRVLQNGEIEINKTEPSEQYIRKNIDSIENTIKALNESDRAKILTECGLLEQTSNNNFDVLVGKEIKRIYESYEVEMLYNKLINKIDYFVNKKDLSFIYDPKAELNHILENQKLNVIKEVLLNNDKAFFKKAQELAKPEVRYTFGFFPREVKDQTNQMVADGITNMYVKYDLHK